VDGADAKKSLVRTVMAVTPYEELLHHRRTAPSTGHDLEVDESRMKKED